MILFEKSRENADAIRRMGEQAIAEAKRLGLPAHYVDPTLGEGIIRELPDGTRQRLQRVDGVRVIVETFEPRQ